MEDDQGQGIGGPFLVLFMSCAVGNHAGPEPLAFLGIGLLNLHAQLFSPQFDAGYLTTSSAALPDLNWRQ